MSLFKSVLVFLLLPVALRAQSDVPITQFWNTLMQTNPATAGLNYRHAAHAVYHRDGYNYNTNYGINLDYGMRLDSINSGIGITYAFNLSPNVGSHQFLAHYAYHFHLKGSILSLGASAGVRALYQASLASHPPAGSSFQDDYASSGFQFNAGIAYHWKNLNAGISSTNMNSPSLSYRDGHGTVRFAPIYWFFADYTFQLPANIQLRPQFQAMNNGTTYWNTFSLMAIWNKQVWAGVNYNNHVYFSGMAGVDIREKYRMGVSYGQSSSGVPGWGTSRSVEVVLAYLLK